MAAATELVPGGSYNIFGSGHCSVDNTSSPMYCKPGGDSSEPASQISVGRPDNSTNPIRPGDQILWKSAKTGKYCRLNDQPSGISTIICDLDSPTAAATLTYTGTGFTYQGRPFIPGTGGGAAYFGSVGQPAPPTYVTAPAIPANIYINILNPAVGSSYIRNDNTTSLAYAGSSDGSTLPEQYIAQPPGGSPSVTSIPVGSPVILRNAQTGMYGRIVDASSYPGASIKAAASAPPVAGALLRAVPVPQPSTMPTGRKPLPPSGTGRGLLADHPEQPKTEPATLMQVPTTSSEQSTGHVITQERAIRTTPPPPVTRPPRISNRQAPGPPPKSVQQSQVASYGMVADQPTAATASVFIYTGNSLAYNGQQMVASSRGARLLLSSTALPTSLNAHLTFKPAATTAPPPTAPNTGEQLSTCHNDL